MVPLLTRLNDYGRSGTRKGIRGVEIGALLQGYRNLLQLIPDTDTVCLLDPLNLEKTPLTHRRLRKFIGQEFDLGKFGLSKGSRVAVLLPNGPELAVAMLAVVSQWCAAPINPTNTWQEIQAELQKTRARAVIILAGASGNEAVLQACKDMSIGIIVISPTEAITGLFRLNVLTPVPAPIGASRESWRTTGKGFKAFDHPETVLLLHTSGTSGNKKLVPYSLDMLVIGVGCIVSAWNLSPSDVCLNMMPLFHIGGIVRNIFSPVLSGGAVIACSGFDPLLFWDVLSSQTVTWYYAAPTMHHAILMEAEQRSKPLPVAPIRFIANAAGGLLPVLAEALRSCFDAVVLTGYGMTEWYFI